MSSLKFYAKPNPMGCRIRLRYTYNRDSRCDFFCGVEITDEKNFNSNNDLTPIKKAGRIIGAILMTTGVGIFGTFTALVSSWFIDKK